MFFSVWEYIIFPVLNKKLLAIVHYNVNKSKNLEVTAHSNSKNEWIFISASRELNQQIKIKLNEKKSNVQLYSKINTDKHTTSKIINLKVE